MIDKIKNVLQMMSPYIEMTKPRITLFVLITTTFGYYLGDKGGWNYWELLFLLIGAGLTCGGSAVLNNYVERNVDCLMKRTQNRPIPSGRVSENRALFFGLTIMFIGLIILYIKINVLTAFLSLLTSFLYVLVYTPMKRVSWLNTTVGAIPGAIPPLGGWAAATGTLNFDSGMLFLIMFIWQHPHFYAIAWLLKEDYERGGFQMLPCIDSTGEKTFQQILWWSIVLIPISLIPTLTGLLGYVYFFGSLILGVLLLMTSLKFIRTAQDVDARNLLKATIYYLPILLFLILLDSGFL